MQRQFLVQNRLAEPLVEPLAQLHLEMLAWLEHGPARLRQESLKLVTVVSADLRTITT